MGGRSTTVVCCVEMGGGRRRGERILLKTVVNGTGRAETGVRTPRGAAKRPASRSMESSAKDLTDGTSEGVVIATSGTAEDRSRGGGVVAASAAMTAATGGGGGRRPNPHAPKSQTRSTRQADGRAERSPRGRLSLPSNRPDGVDPGAPSMGRKPGGVPAQAWKWAPPKQSWEQATIQQRRP
jgi:hypothetical protein